MPSLVSLLQQHRNSKSDFEELAEEFYADVKGDDGEDSDLKTHVKACSKRFKLLTLIDLHSLGEIRKLKKWIILGGIAIVFFKPMVMVAMATLKGATIMDLVQLFLSL